MPRMVSLLTGHGQSSLSSTGTGALAQFVFAQSEELELGKSLPCLFSKCLQLTPWFVFANVFHFTLYYPSGHIWMFLFVIVFVRIILFFPSPALYTNTVKFFLNQLFEKGIIFGYLLYRKGTAHFENAFGYSCGLKLIKKTQRSVINYSKICSLNCSHLAWFQPNGLPFFDFFTKN